MKNRVELLRLQLQKEKDAVKKHKQLTKETIQKKIEVNKVNQWVNNILRRKSKTTQMKSIASINSENAIKISEWAIKNNYMTYIKPSIWSNSMTPEKSKTCQTNITAK